jgi:hypothetical protein
MFSSAQLEPPSILLKEDIDTTSPDASPKFTPAISPFKSPVRRRQRGGDISSSISAFTTLGAPIGADFAAENPTPLSFSGEASNSPVFNPIFNPVFSNDPDQTTPDGFVASPNRARTKIKYDLKGLEATIPKFTVPRLGRSLSFSGENSFQPIRPPVQRSSSSCSIFRAEGSASPNAVLLSDSKRRSLISPVNEVPDSYIADEDSDEADVKWGQHLMELVKRNSSRKANRLAVKSRKRKPACRKISFSGIKVIRPKLETSNDA